MQTAHESRRRARSVVHADAKPNGRQIFYAARLLCEIAGVPFPETRGEASELISRLESQRDAITSAATSGDEIPF